MNQLLGAFERVAVYLLPVVMTVLFTSHLQTIGFSKSEFSP